jgi:flagellin-like hook-associated protein FlgL
MMTNSTLININRNMRHLDTLIRQIESTKKIQVPSDDPIIASRALKFRTSVSEIGQFQRNVQSGMAWMEVSEAALMDTTRNIMKQLTELTVEGATGTQQLSDKMALLASMKELVAQVGLNMNQTFAGRYVFSGFRTDQPPIFTDNNNKTFVITQTFNVRDIEVIKSFQKLDSLEKAVVHNDVNIIKMAYTNMDIPVIPGYSVIPKTLNDDDAYIPDANNTAVPPLPIIHFIAETGELVMHKDTANNFKDGTTVTYRKENFGVGDLNPQVYFPSREINVLMASGSVTGNTYRITQSIIPERWVGVPALPAPATHFTFNMNTVPGNLAYNQAISTTGTPPAFWPSVEGYNVVAWSGVATTVPDGTNTPVGFDPRRDILFNPATGVMTIAASGSQQFLERNRNVSYSATMAAGALSPAHNLNVQSVQLQLPAPGLQMDNADPNRFYTMDNQHIKYEFSTKTYVTINTLAMDVYTDKMFADFRRLFEFADTLQLSDKARLEEHYRAGPPPRSSEEASEMATKQLVEETAQLNAVLHDRFNNMLRLLDVHSVNAMREHTQMGSRMYRLELMQNRLEEDEGSYTKLMSENEDTNMARAIVMKAAAEAAYAAALRASANIVQLSLANFI